MVLIRLSLSVLLTLLLIGFPARSASAFVEGDLYLLTAGHPDPEIVIGILRIVPSTGAVSSLGEFAFTPRAFAYDPYRDRLVCSDDGGGGLVTVDEVGEVTPFVPAIAAPFLIEARGDGILYLFYSGTMVFAYVDAANVLHDLLDESGMHPFVLESDGNPTELQYDVETNSLLVFGGTNTGLPGCPDPARSCVVRLPLNAEATQVAGAVVATQVDVSPSSYEVVVGASQGPGDSVLWVVDTNVNDQEPRMQILDPATLVSLPFASNGPYTGAASTNAGLYSRLLGQAVILDTYNNWLRAFSYGTVGAGSVVATGVSDTGSGEVARLVEIRPSPFPTAVGLSTPGRVALLPPFPNPFNATTELRVRLDAPAPVSLKIYDASGRHVRTLADGSLAAGEHLVPWDGRDDEGGVLPSGVYFAQVAGGGQQEVQKLILLK